MTIAVSAVSVAVVTVAVSNSGLIRDWPEDRSVLGGAPERDSRNPAPASGNPALQADRPSAAEIEPSAYLLSLPVEEPAGAPAQGRPGVAAAAPQADFAASFADLPQPSQPMALAPEPPPTVLLFDSTRFAAPPTAVVSPPAVRDAAPDPVEHALSNAAVQPAAALTWQRPPLAETPSSIALAAPSAPILADPLARVEGIAEAPLGEPLSAGIRADFAAAPTATVDSTAAQVGVAAPLNLAPSFEEAAGSFSAPTLEAVEGIATSPSGDAGLAAPAEGAVSGDGQQSARLRKELSTSLARLRERQAQSVPEQAVAAARPLGQSGDFAGGSGVAAFEQSNVNVVSDGNSVGSAAIRVDQSQMVSIRLSELISLFEDHLDKPLFVWLKNSGAASQFATLDTLRSAGIAAEYDADRAQISLSIADGD